MPSTPDATLAFRFASRQRYRYRVGLGGVAVIVWCLGIVRLAVAGRLSTPSGLGALALFGLALAALAVAVGRLQPLLVLDAEALHARWGPRRLRVPWSEVTGVEVVARGVVRRVAIDRGDRRTLLPVPRTGASILGPGPDPELDHKADLVRQWWQDHSGP